MRNTNTRTNTRTNNSRISWGEHKKELKESLNKTTYDKEIIPLLINSRNNKQKIFVMGNGGSAAVALNLAADLNKCSVKNYEQNKDRYDVTSLCGEISMITAISNDLDYSEVFRQQLINHAKKGDIVILISGSGNSPNIIKAADYCKKNKLICIGFTGFNGGKLKKICDYNLYVPTYNHGIAEDVHNIFSHFLTKKLLEAYDYE